MPNGMYGGVRGKETKIGRKTISFPYLLDFQGGGLIIENYRNWLAEI